MRTRSSASLTRRARSARVIFALPRWKRRPNPTLSATVRWGNSAGVWNTLFTGRSSGGDAARSRPSRWIVPLSACSNPAINRSSVDLPLPVGPTIEKNSPPSTSKVRSARAATFPNHFVTPTASRRPVPALMPNAAVGVRREHDPWPWGAKLVAVAARRPGMPVGSRRGGRRPVGGVTAQPGRRSGRANARHGGEIVAGSALLTRAAAPTNSAPAREIASRIAPIECPVVTQSSTTSTRSSVARSKLRVMKCCGTPRHVGAEVTSVSAPGWLASRLRPSTSPAPSSTATRAPRIGPRASGASTLVTPLVRNGAASAGPSTASTVWSRSTPATSG